LEFYREGGSEKHLRDIEAMRRISRELIREDVLRRWLIARGVEETWESIEQPE
jgi:predicted RNA-binding protein associated with RNAse of E/G family